LRGSEWGLIHKDNLRDLLLGGEINKGEKNEVRKLPESGHFQEQK
jgi:hypothetical protein